MYRARRHAGHQEQRDKQESKVLPLRLYILVGGRGDNEQVNKLTDTFNDYSAKKEINRAQCFRLAGGR